MSCPHRNSVLDTPPSGPTFARSRILYVGPADISFPTGPGVNEYEFIVAAIHVPGVEWRFIVPQPSAAWPEDVPRHQCHYYDRLGRGIGPLKWLRSQWQVMRCLEAEIQTFRPDLIIARPTLLPIGIARVLRGARTPYVLRHCHDGALVQYDRLPLIGQSLKAVNRRVLHHLGESATFIELMSALKLQRFRSHFPSAASKAVLVRNGVNTERFRPMARTEARKELGLRPAGAVVGYVGNYPWRRGGRVLLEAVRLLRDDGERVSTIVLGDDGDRGRLIRLADRLGLGDSALIPGRVPFQRVPQYIGACDVCVSLLEKGEMHASAQKVLQYVACGRPVVANHPDAAFVVGAGIGSIVEGGARSVANALRYWLRPSSEHAQPVEERARAYALEQLSYTRRLQERVSAWTAAVHPVGAEEARAATSLGRS